MLIGGEVILIMFFFLLLNLIGKDFSDLILIVFEILKKGFII